MAKLKHDQIAIGNYHYTAWSFDYFLNSAVGIGLKNIEIWGAKPHLVVGVHSDNHIREMKRKIDDKGLKVICFCPEQNSYPVDITTADHALREASLDHMKRSIEVTAMLGARRMLLCPGNGYMEESFEAMQERFVTSCRELAETAKDYDVTLVLETQAQFDSLFINTVEQQKAALTMVDHPNFKAMLDTVQLAQFDRSVEDSLEILGLENTVHVHLGQTIVREMTRAEKSLPEAYCLGRSVIGHIGFREGNLPLIRDLTKLAEAGYRDYVTIEICQRPYFTEADRYGREAYEVVAEVIE